VAIVDDKYILFYLDRHLAAPLTDTDLWVMSRHK
jgi:hypothetical protein